VIPIFVIVIYIYANEVERRNWNVVFAGLAFWGMDLFNEIWNALVFHFTGFSAVWTAPGKTAYLILIGLNIEITLMFAIMGVVVAKTWLSIPLFTAFLLAGLQSLPGEQVEAARSSASTCSSARAPSGVGRRPRPRPAKSTTPRKPSSVATRLRSTLRSTFNARAARSKAPARPSARVPATTRTDSASRTRSPE
jgi:hypothetical protein